MTGTASSVTGKGDQANKMKLKIAIIGAGLGGLTAAFCFARGGHEVVVLEQRKQLSARGGGLLVRPGASRTLYSWGMRNDMRSICVATPVTTRREVTTGNFLARNHAANAIEDVETPELSTTREELMELIYRRAVEAGAHVRFGARVTGVKDEVPQSRVEVEVEVDGSGKPFEADLVLAADGVRSNVRHLMFANAAGPVLSPVTAHQMDLELSDELLQREPSLALYTEIDTFNVWTGRRAYVISMYNENTKRLWINYCTEDEAMSHEDSLWDSQGDLDYVRRWFAQQPSCRALMAVLDNVTTCSRWRFTEMPDQPTWRTPSGRVILLGDSAHGMLPSAGQGYSQIVENIGALEFLVNHSADPAQNMSNITAAWEAIRKPRVERIKHFANHNNHAFRGLVAPKPGSASARPTTTVTESSTPSSSQQQTPESTIQADSTAPFTSPAFLKWVTDYDAAAEARKYVEQVRPRL